MTDPNLEVLTAKVEALTEIVKSGFSRQDGRMDEHGKRLHALEIWRATNEAEDRTAAKDKDWHLKALVGLTAVIGAIGTLVQLVHP